MWMILTVFHATSAVPVVSVAWKIQAWLGIQTPTSTIPEQYSTS